MIPVTDCDKTVKNILTQQESWGIGEHTPWQLKEFDEKFDRGEKATQFLDRARARKPGLEQKRVNVDFPVWMIDSLDREARRRGVTRQSIIRIVPETTLLPFFQKDITNLPFPAKPLML